MSSFNRIVIDSAALAHNYRYLQSRVDSGVGLMAMVKSDGYGHSMIHAARVFRDNGCSLFGVAEMEEGVVLRESGCSGKIFVFLGFDHADIDYLFKHTLTPVIFTFEDLVKISEAEKKLAARLDVYLKFDCGMSRLGFAPSEAAAIFAKCRELSIQPRGIISHFPCSDDRRSDHSRQAAEIFYRIDQQQPDETPLVKSICNSGGLLYHPDSHGDMVRAGISIYGYYPDGKKGRQTEGIQGLRPAMSCCSRIIQIKTVATGTGISYGHTYVTPGPTRLAVLPIGYSDGYLRTLSNRAEVLIHGRRAPIRGRICMNMCMADITDIEGVEVGDDAVLLGSQGDGTIDADEIGGWSDTISYEVLCSLGNNNRREFVS